MLDVVTIGAAVLDIFLKSDQFKIDKSHPDGVLLCERYEGKIEAQEIVMTSGGGATNSAVSYARKDLRVAAIIEMGRDPAAEIILLDLAREKVDLQFVIQEQNEITAVSAILLSGGPPSARQGGNSVVTYRGASRMLTKSDAPFDKLGMSLKPDGWIHLTSVGGDMELVNAVLVWAKEKRRKVFWNPGASEISKIKDQRSKRQLKTQNWPNVLQMNRKEASEFFGVNFLDEKVWKSEHCPTPEGTTLVITDGERGGRVCHQGECIWFDAIKTTMISSTGAGDAFGSGFVAGLIYGKSVKEAIEWGKRQSARVVGTIGAKAGLLTTEEIIGNKRISTNK